MAVSEAPASAGALVSPKYGVGDKCSNCGMAMKRMPTGEVGCPGCGKGMKKAVGFVVETVESKEAPWNVKEAQREGHVGLYLEGYASTWGEDRDGDTVARDAFDSTIKSYLEDNPVLLLDHQRDRVLGLITEAKADDVGLAIKAWVPKPESDEERWKTTAYRDIKRGLRKALSIGGVFHRDQEKSARNRIIKVDLYEISNIPVPSNPKSLFRVVAEKGLEFPGVKATDSDDDASTGVSHTHAKVGGGTQRHKHSSADPGHKHEGLLPTLKKGAMNGETKDADDDPGTLAQAIDAALDEAMEELEDGDVEQATALVTAAAASADSLLSALNVSDPDDPDDDASDSDDGKSSQPEDDKSSHQAQGGSTKMADDIETKGVDAHEDDDKKTVTLTAEQFKEFQGAQRRLEEAERNQKAEQVAERVAAERMEKERKAEEVKAAQERQFMEQVATIVDSKLQSSRSGRKYVVPSVGENTWNASRPAEQKSVVNLLYRKSKGDPEARAELVDMSQKAAAEYGIKAIGEGATAGFLVPPHYMQQGIAEYRIAAAKVRQLCTVIPGIGTNLVYIPRETGIATVGWTSENAPKPSTDQTFGQLAVNIFTLAGISKVSNQLLEDSTPAVDMLVRKDLGRLLGQAEDIAFLVGTGAGQPTGILNTTGILTGALGAATIADALASAVAAIQANYYGDPEAIVMNPKHLNVIRTAKDANLRYIFEPAFFTGNDPRNAAFMANNGGAGPNGNLGGGYSNMPGQGGPQGTVWGLPVYADANLPAPTNNGNIVVGAFSEAYILERTGVTIDVSSEAGTSFEQNQTWFRGEERLGFTAARQPTAFYSITAVP